MTRDEIMKMKPGRELDALVARKLFGVLNPDSRWRPSEDISAAWEVAEKFDGFAEIRRHHRATGIGEDGVWVWTAGLSKGGYCHWATAQTAPEAICKSALLAVMGE